MASHQSVTNKEMQIQIRNVTQTPMRKERSFFNLLFLYLFYIQFLLIALLVIFLTFRGFLSARTHDFDLQKWYVPVLSSTACAGIVGFAWQEFTRINPAKAIKAAFWLSPLLTCGFGILLVYISTPGSLAAAVIALASSIFQALYACWVIRRFQHATRILKVSSTYHPPRIKATVILSILTCILYVSFFVAGIGGATSTNTRLDGLFIFFIVISFSWTMQIVKNMIQVTISHVKYMHFVCSIGVELKPVMNNTIKYSLGSICIGSILIPVISVIWGLARAVNLITGDVDEFMFSCADCCSGVASRIVVYGNRWGLLQVGLYNKGIVQASKDTWEMFTRAGIEKLINSDLTSTFCFLCGVAAGSTCGLLGGSWAVVVQKTYATEVSIYTFLIGYFMSRVAMAWVQASVTAYYVAYAENPQNEQFDTTIPDYIRELERSQV